MPPRSRNVIQELRIGPFAGGVNQYSDQSAIADDELVDCVNFDIDLDGSLKSRPPWQLLMSDESTVATGSVPPESNQLLLGSFVYEGVQFVIFMSNHTGTRGAYVYYIGGANDDTTALINTGSFTYAVRYANDIYLIPGMEGYSFGDHFGTGVKYDLATGLVTTIANMPRGYAQCVYKDRLWISGRRNIEHNSRLYFSELADFTSWPGTNFFDVNPGDGDAVQDLAVYQDNIMIFKDNRTYVFSYDSGPAQAVLQAVNSSVGVMGPRCVVAYENSLFLLQYNEVYEMVNFDFTRVSVKVPFEYDHTTPDEGDESIDQWWKYSHHLSLVGDRLIARFFNRMYVYHLRLRAWTRWESEDENIHYLGPVIRMDNTNTDLNRGYETYLATSSLAKVVDATGYGIPGAWTTRAKIFYMEDRYGDSAVENGNITPNDPDVDIKLHLLTKTYDIGLSHRFKRLMHWGVDTITGREITGTTYPFSVAYKVTWAQLHIYHWHELNTWGYPLLEIPSITQIQPIGTGIDRRYVRFPKSLRFRLVQFRIDMMTAGNTVDGPARLYSVTAFIGGKQLAPAAVN